MKHVHPVGHPTLHQVRHPDIAPAGGEVNMFPGYSASKLFLFSSMDLGHMFATPETASLSPVSQCIGPTN